MAKLLKYILFPVVTLLLSTAGLIILIAELFDCLLEWRNPKDYWIDFLVISVYAYESMIIGNVNYN